MRRINPRECLPGWTTIASTLPTRRRSRTNRAVRNGLPRFRQNKYLPELWLHDLRDSGGGFRVRERSIDRISSYPEKDGPPIRTYRLYVPLDVDSIFERMRTVEVDP